MNLLEQYIEEIHSVKPHTADWTKKFNKEFVEVEITTNCYGVTETKKRIFDTDEWEQVKFKGYFMA